MKLMILPEMVILPKINFQTVNLPPKVNQGGHPIKPNFSAICTKKIYNLAAL